MSKTECATDIPGHCKGISGPHLRVSGAFWLIYFTFLMSRVGGQQEVRINTALQTALSMMIHLNRCQLFDVQWHLTVQWSAFKGYQCQDENKQPPQTSFDVQDVDDNQNNLSLFMVQTCICLQLETSQSCKLSYKVLRSDEHVCVATGRGRSCI